MDDIMSLNIQDDNQYNYENYNENDKIIKLNSEMKKAAENNDLKLMKKLYRKNVNWSTIIFTIAVDNANFEMMEWLYKYKFPFDDYTFAVAASRMEKTVNAKKSFSIISKHTSNKELMNWLFKRRCPISATVFAFAAKKGHLPDMIWLKDVVKCPWDERVYIGAATNGNIKNLKWLYEHNIPHNTTAFEMAVLNGTIDTMKWLYEHGFKYDTSAFSAAIFDHNIEKLEWMHLRNFSVSKHVMRIAKECKDINVINWLIQYGYGTINDIPKESAQIKTITKSLKRVKIQ